MKKVIPIILLCACLIVPALNLYGIDILTENKEGKSGETVDVNIYLATYAGEQISAFGLNFNYNYENLSFMSKEDIKCDLTQNFDLLRGNEAKGGTIIISGIEPSDPILANSIGCFLKLKFKIRDGAVPGKYPMTIDNLVDNIEGANVINGTFTITAPQGTKTVDIYSNGSVFRANDTLRIGVKVINSSEDVLNMYAALMVGNNLFFYPQWNKTPHATQINPGIWDEPIAVIPMPQNPPVGTYNFVSAITDLQTVQVFGVDSVIVELK
jgi:hypothetical protein